MLKLDKLYSNQPSFHTVKFKDGINIVLGVQENLKTKNSTTNGIGKSLILRLIDFCLGSNTIKTFEKPLAGWSFFLDFSIDNQIFSVKRDINNQREVVLNEEKISLYEYKNKLAALLEIDSAFSFRNVLARFLRMGKKSYANYLTTVTEKSYNNNLIITYLLGLDCIYCINKHKLMDEIDATDKMSKNAKNDTNLKNFFGIKGDMDLELSEIDFEIEKLTKELAQYKIAENYAEIEEKANIYSEEIDILQNQIFIIKNRIENIELSLSRTIDIELAKVRSIYKEVNALWGKELDNNLEAVVNFHKTLIDKRHEQLSKDLLDYKNELSEHIKMFNEKQVLLNNELEFLQSHKAIDKYLALNNKLNAYQADKNRLKKYANLEKEFKAKLATLRQDLSVNNINTQTYLDSIESYTFELNKKFINLAKRFFPEKKSAFTIKSNDSAKSQTRFDYDARIESDGSDGIKEIIIFCFDWILASCKKTKMGFIYHDSLLLANVENRQREILFEIITELCKKSDIQYIININQDQINCFNAESIEHILNNKILELTDKDASSKLLGMEVELQEEIVTE